VGFGCSLAVVTLSQTIIFINTKIQTEISAAAEKVLREKNFESPCLETFVQEGKIWLLKEKPTSPSIICSRGSCISFVLACIHVFKILF